MADINFNANDVPPSSPNDPVPAGTYRAHITGSEVKPTKDTKGRILKFEWTILDGDHKGRKFWSQLNIVNPNAQAQEIAQRELSSICHATGVMQLKNSQQLHHIPCLVKLTVKQDPGYEPQNRVKSYTAVEGGPGIKPPKNGNTAFGAAAGQAAVATSAAPAAPAAASPATPPWARKAG